MRSGTGVQMLHGTVLSLNASILHTRPFMAPFLSLHTPQLPILDFDADPDPNPAFWLRCGSAAYHSNANAVPDPDPAFKMMRIWVRNTARFTNNLFVEDSVNLKFTESKQPAVHCRKRCEMGKHCRRQQACSSKNLCISIKLTITLASTIVLLFCEGRGTKSKKWTAQVIKFNWSLSNSAF